MSDPTMDSFVRNCHLQVRKGDDVLFEGHLDADGNTVMRARLDGYAIIPIEVYETLNHGRPVT